MSEQELLQGLLNKEESAFREIVERYQKNIMNTCLAMVHDKDDAKDLAQEVFLELLVSGCKLRGDCRISTWLHRVAVNKSLNHLARIKRRNMFSFFTGNETTEYLENIPDRSENRMEKNEKLKVLHMALDSLPKSQKIAFTLLKYDDLSYKEISDVMNVSVSSVESLIFRAKQNLHKKLTKYVTCQY